MLGERFLYDAKPVISLDERQMEARNRVIREQEDPNGHYPFESFCCECGAGEEAFDVLAEKDRYGLKSRTVICRKCGLVMTNPRMTQEGYDYFYDKEYGKLYRDHDGPDEMYFTKRALKGKQIYDYVKTNSEKPISSVLEIGCAAGGILYYFHAMGCKVTGVDLGSEYIRFGQEKGLNLRQCHSRELVKEGKKFDLIIINHVLEHFLNIGEELEVVKELLSQDGICYIEVPGIKYLTKSYYMDFLIYLQNAHIYHFTLETLEQVMNKYGFELLTGDDMVRSLFRYSGNRTDNGKNYFLDVMSFLYALENYREKAIQKKKSEDNETE